MSIPVRNAAPSEIVSSSRTFFVTSKTIQGRNLLQSDAFANLLIDILRSYAAAKKFIIHDFVVMPNHLHVLLTLDAKISIEKAMQLIKGGFSYRLKKELGYCGGIWQPGYSEVRVRNRASFLAYRDYIYMNPVKAGLVDAPEKYPYCSLYLKRQKAAGAKKPK